MTGYDHPGRIIQAALARLWPADLIGNGGIATELVHELQNIDIDWIIKDNSIGMCNFCKYYRV